MTSRLPARSRSARVLARSDVGSNQRPDHTQDVCMAPRAASRNRYGVRRNRRRVPNISCRHPSPDGTVSRGPTHLGPLRTEDSATDVTGTWLPRAFQELVVGGRSLKAGWQSPYHALLGVAAVRLANGAGSSASTTRTCKKSQSLSPSGSRTSKTLRCASQGRSSVGRAPVSKNRWSGVQVPPPLPEHPGKGGALRGASMRTDVRGLGGIAPPGPPIKGSIDSQRRSV